MNSAVLNLVALNESNEIWSWEGDSAIAVQADGAIQLGLTLQGTADVQLAGSGVGFMYAVPGFTPAGIALAATGALTYGVTGSGSASISLDSAANGTRWVLGESLSEILFQAIGDGQVVAPAAASFTIVLESTLDARSTPAIPGEGEARIVINASLEPHLAKAHWLESEATDVVVATIAQPYLVVHSPVGSSALRLDAFGEARLGGKIQLEPLPAELSLYTRGELGYRHYVYASGTAQIVVESAAARHGIPQIPSDYTAAPGIRVLRVNSEQRRFIVPAERRL